MEVFFLGGYWLLLLRSKSLLCATNLDQRASSAREARGASASSSSIVEALGALSSVDWRRTVP